MSGPRRILGKVDAGNPAWVPGEVEREADQARRFTPTALRMMDESIIVWHEDPERGAQLAADAGAIFGGGVLLALQDMQAEGRLPAPGTPAWDDFAAAAEAGDVELAIVVLVRDREPVCEDRVARRLGQAAPAPAKPISLADEMRAMGLM
jgi:hypothetical protein